MAVPTASDGQYDSLMTDFAVGFSEENANKYIADRVFPVVPVGRPSASFRKFPRGYFLQDNVGLLPDNGTPNELYIRSTTDNYSCEVEALRARITNVEAATWVGPGDPRNNKVRALARSHLIHRDRAWVSNFMRPDLWGTDLFGSATGSEAGAVMFLDNANVDLVDFISELVDDQSRRGAEPPNTMVMGRAVRRAFRRNPVIKDAIKYTQTGVASLPLLASLLDLANVFSPTGAYNRTGTEVIDPATGEAVIDENYGFIVGENDLLLVHAGEPAGQDTVSGGVHFAWTGVSEVAGNPMGSAMATPVGQAGSNADPSANDITTAVNRGTWDYGEWMDQLCAFDAKMVSPDLGVYIENAVQGSAA